ncbi:Serine/threonine protein kinase [Trema orientale]|uniref:Serine/threonine protein kinase n=1 Tax=Trema orientale TaxID=63057 RepID=A0A2P5FZY5_TREOI|nr:Serine/threonine protein kinase [Trema orientale]
MWMRKPQATLSLLTATGLTFHALNPRFPSFSHDSSDFPEKIRAALDGVFRSSRAISTIALTALDYKFSMRGLPTDSDEYRRKLSEVHLRSAERILKLCDANKGFYVKAGQFVAALRQVPKEYSSTLSALQDQAVPYHFKAIKEVLIRNLGQDLSEIFLSLEENPIAAASIAQVHRAVLKDGQEVAIKVQYAGLQQQLKIDTTIMSFLSKSIAWFFPEYRFEWLVSEFVEDIVVELDFIQEARNSERTANNFKNNKMVKVPHVFWDLTTNQVLTMQFCRGQKVDDVVYMKKQGIDPIKVAKVVVEIFAEMIFVHGFVHGDPHPGNILVCPEGRHGFSVVLLDHGIYRQLDEGFRLQYCELWKAMIVLDSNKIQLLGEQFGVAKYFRYFPVIFTGRTIDSKRALGGRMSDREKSNLKKELKSLRMEDISSFMESLPPDFLRILRIDGLLRSIMNKLGASQRVRLLAYAKFALRGLSPGLNCESDFSVKVMLSRLKTNISYLQLRLALEVLELLYRVTQVPKLLYAWYGSISGLLRGIFNSYYRDDFLPKGR